MFGNPDILNKSSTQTYIERVIKHITHIKFVRREFEVLNLREF